MTNPKFYPGDEVQFQPPYTTVYEVVKVQRTVADDHWFYSLRGTEEKYPENMLRAAVLPEPKFKPGDCVVLTEIKNPRLNIGTIDTFPPWYNRETKQWWYSVTVRGQNKPHAYGHTTYSAAESALKFKEEALLSKLQAATAALNVVSEAVSAALLAQEPPTT